MELSVIIPAYNEEKRLPKMLDECIAYLVKRESDHPFLLCFSLMSRDFTWEIIIVDDGSKDRTKEIGWEYAKRYNNQNIRVLVEYHNRGKGGAIRMVMHRFLFNARVSIPAEAVIFSWQMQMEPQRSRKLRN